MTVPQIPEDVQPQRGPAWTFVITEMDIHGNDVCATIEYEGGQALFVLPEGATATRQPLAITFGEVVFQKGSELTSGPLRFIEGGFDCGSKHWDRAVQLVGADPQLLPGKG